MSAIEKKSSTVTAKVNEEKAIAAAKEAVEKTANVVKEAAAKVKASKTTAAVKKTVKKAVATTKEKLAEPKTNIYVEYQGQQIRMEDMVSAVKRHWGAAGHKSGDLKSLELYVKPEDSAVYYVANETVHGKISF